MNKIVLKNADGKMLKRNRLGIYDNDNIEFTNDVNLARVDSFIEEAENQVEIIEESTGIKLIPVRL